MHGRDQSFIFSTDRKFHFDYGLLLELHALTLVARSYTLLYYGLLLELHALTLVAGSYTLL